ncbi:MAG: lamin tail domain-containing protein, partial [Pyrinomonadaceae bacterium]
VVGRVLKAGQPFAGAMVTTLGNYSATTGADGTFNIAGVPTISANLVANATYTHPSGSVFAGTSNPAAPVRGGTTNAGDVLLSNTAKLIISEFRWQGQGGTADEFVEIYNSGDTPHVVETSDGSSGYALAASDGAARFIIPAGTVIPPRAHFLGVNSVGYSLATHPAGDGTTANGDATYTTDIPDNAGLALFNTSNPANFTLANRLDAVGPTSESDALYREGAGVSWPAPHALPYSCYRSLCSHVAGVGCTVPGTPKETNDNATDFVCVCASGPGGGPAAGLTLGAAGPENLSSPLKGRVQGAPTVTFGPVSTMFAPSSAPNIVRETVSDPANNATYGLIKFRVEVTNKTGQNITSIRFRVADLTTYPAPAGTADLRPRTSGATGAQVKPGVMMTVQGTTLEQSFQQYGGGFNSTLSAVTVTPSQPLAPGALLRVQFVFGVQQTGAYRLGLNIETLPRSNTEMIVFTGQTN